MPKDPIHDRLLAIVLALPGAREDHPWGSTHCKVNDKIFVGWGRHDDGKVSLGFKTDKSLQSMLIASDPRFTMAKYVGKHGWLDMALDANPNWEEIEQFIVESYRMIAPKKLVQELDARPTSRPKPASNARATVAETKKSVAKQSTAKKSLAKKPAAKKSAPTKLTASTRRASKS